MRVGYRRVRTTINVMSMKDEQGNENMMGMRLSAIQSVSACERV